MTQVVIHGFAQSSYVWTARAICAIKGVDVDFHPIAPPEHKHEAHLARHPFGKVPAFAHGDFKLYETSAIGRYVDATFEGPSLIPTDPKSQALMEQWISVTNSYFYPDAVMGYIFAYVFPGTEDGSPNTDKIAKILPKLHHTLGLFNDTLADNTWLVGDQLTLADLLFAPLLLGVGRFPEGKEFISQHPNLGRYVGQITQNGAFMSVAPTPG